MNTACQMVWKCAGEPVATRTVGAPEQPGRCAICGGWDEQSVPLRMRMYVSKRGDGLPQLVTVLRGSDHGS